MPQVVGRPSRLFLGYPLPRHGLEGVGVLGMGSPAVRLADGAPDECLASPAPAPRRAFPRIVKRYMPALRRAWACSLASRWRLDILANGKDVFLASDAIPVAPQLRAGGLISRYSPPPSVKLIGLSPGLVLRIFASVRGMMRVSGEVIPATIPAISSDGNGRCRLLPDANPLLLLEFAPGIG